MTKKRKIYNPVTKRSYPMVDKTSKAKKNKKPIRGLWNKNDKSRTPSPLSINDQDG
jgi:hypothetical protein